MKTQTLTVTPPPHVATPSGLPPARRSHGRWLLIALGVLLLLVCFVPLAAATWLQSRSGETYLRRQIESRTNSAIQGHVEMDAVRLSGFLRIEIDGLRLYAPGALRPVASFRRVAADFRPIALLGRRLAVSEFIIDGARLQVGKENGANAWTEALAPRPSVMPSARAPSSTSAWSRWHLSAASVKVRDSDVTFAGERPVSVRGLNLDGEVKGTLSELRLAARTQAHVVSPVERAVSLDIRGTYASDHLEVDHLGVSAGRSTLDLAGALRFDRSLASLRIAELRVDPADVNAFAPGADLLQPLHLDGTAMLDQGAFSGRFRFEAANGSAGLDFSGDVDGSVRAPSDIRDFRVSLDLNGIDPSQLRGTLPEALLKGHAVVIGRGPPLSGTADVSADLSGSRYEKLAVDQLELAAHSEGETARISELAIRTANIEMTAGGLVDRRSADLRVEARASDLGRTRQLLMKGIKVAPPVLSGSAHVTAEINGEWANPRITLSTTAPSIAVGPVGATDLNAHVELGHLRPAPAGSFTLSADRITAGERTGGHISATGAIDGRRADVDAHGTLGRTPIELVLHGEHQRGTAQQVWVFQTLRAQALGLSVFSNQPMRFEYAPSRTEITNLRLAGDLGDVALDARFLRGGITDARLRVDSLRAERLPADLVPKDLKLAGTIGLAAELHGSLAKPQGTATLHLAGGRYRNLSNIGGDAEARVDGRRADVRLTARVAGGETRAQFSGPIVAPTQALKTAASEPVSLALKVDHVGVADVERAMQQQPSVDGVVSGTLDLSGTVREPILRTEWTATNVSASGVDGLEASLRGSYSSGTWAAEGDLHRRDGIDANVRGQLQLPAADLLSGDDPRWKSREGQVVVSLLRAKLDWLAQAGLLPPDTTGDISGRVSAEGSLQAPRVNGTLKVSNVSASGYTGVSAIADLQTDDHITFSANAWMNEQPLIGLKASLQESPGHLAAMGTEARLRVPFSLEARLAPAPLEQLLPAAAPAPGETPPPFRATAEARIDASGSADDPTAHLRVAIHEQEQQESAGSFTADLDYRNARMAFDALFQSPMAGELRAKARLEADLGAAELMSAGARSRWRSSSTRASAWRAGLAETLSHPADISLDAEHFDLALLNGFTGDIREVGGVMDVHLARTGPLVPISGGNAVGFAAGLSGLHGTLVMNGVKLSMPGEGSFSDVSLKASGTYPTLQITELKGHAGSGSFDGTASLKHAATDQLEGALALNLKDVPIMTDYQTRGQLSMRVTATGTGEPGHIHIPLITIEKGHLKIPERLPRKVQSLDRNPEIDVVRHETRPHPAAQPGRPPWILAVDRIRMPDDFAVDAPLGTQLVLGANLQLRFDPKLAVKGAPPYDLTGKVQIIHGELSLLRRFEVDEGTLTFYPGQIDNPAVHVKAHYDGPDATVTVLITGTLQDPQKAFESNPPMSQDEIVEYLATGQRQTRAQQADPATLQAELADATISALGAAAIGVVQGAVRQILPKEINPDVLSVEADVQHGGIGHVRAGKYYFEGKLYVGGQYNPYANPLLNQNMYEGEAEYRLGGNKYIRVLVGSEGHDELYFMLERSFPTTRQKKNGMR